MDILPLGMVTGFFRHIKMDMTYVFINIYTYVISIFMGLYMYIHKYILRRSDSYRISGLQTVYPNVTEHPSKDIVRSNSKARW